MKKIITISMITLLSLITFKISSAQYFAVGAKAAFSASNFRGDDVTNNKFRKGFQAGAYFAYSPKEWFVVSPELLFDQRGSQEVIFNNVERRININYLTVPIALDFRVPINGIVYPKFLAGPYASFALSEKQTFSSDDVNIAFEETDVNRVDFGGFVGLGVDLESERVKFSTDLRYLFGSIDVATNDNIEFRNTQILLNVAFGFKF